MIEQDDPRGAASVKDILERSPMPVRSIPFVLVPRVAFSFGQEFIDWLEGEIKRRKLRLCILDSYTALRGPRKSGIDIVKAEQSELATLDELGARTQCAIAILHHSTASKAGLDWTLQAGGTFAMGMATEAQIHVARFPELDGNAPERLVRNRGRHTGDTELALRFREKTLDYEYVTEGSAAAVYPTLLEIRSLLGARTFSPKELSHATGHPIRTAHRHIERLWRASVIKKIGYGEYALAEAWR